MADLWEERRRQGRVLPGDLDIELYCRLLRAVMVRDAYPLAEYPLGGGE